MISCMAYVLMLVHNPKESIMQTFIHAKHASLMQVITSWSTYFSNTCHTWHKLITHYLRTTTKQSWNWRETRIMWSVCSVLQKGFSLCILHCVSPNGAVWIRTQEIFCGSEDKLMKFIFTKNFWQRSSLYSICK